MATLAQVLNNCLCLKVYNEVQNEIGIRGIKATSAVEFGDFSSHAELMVNTNRGIWALRPSRLGLKIIVARGCNLNHVISEASRDLVWLRWSDIGQKNLQLLIPFNNLRVLDLHENWRLANHQLQELWMAEVDAPLQLRELLISYCLKFQGFPKSIRHLKQLKRIVLDSALCLESLPEEFCLLQSLEHLEFNQCSELSLLPNSMGSLRNLKHLCLNGCRKLGRLPDSCKELVLLQYLNLGNCPNVTFILDIMENMSKLEFISFKYCCQLEELPHHLPNQASLRELHLEGTLKLKEVPMKMDQLSKLRILSMGGSLLTNLPASLGDLSSLTELQIANSSRLECLPDSLGQLSLLEKLELDDLGMKSVPESICQLINLESLWICRCPVSEVSISSSLCKLKMVDLLDNYQLSKISISESCCARLETLTVEDNRNLREIEGLPSSVRKLVISECPILSALPSFAKLTSLQEFELRGCYKVQKIEGIDHCRELVKLKAYTRWEVPCIQSLDFMEGLRTVHLTAMRKSVIEGCIQSLQKLPGEIIVCTKAIINAASFVGSLAFPTFSVLDSCSNVQTEGKQGPKLVVKQPTIGDTFIVCFVVSTPGMAQLDVAGKGSIRHTSEVEVEEGEWVWIGVFTQRSEWYPSKSFKAYFSMGNGVVEKGFIASGEEDRVMVPLRGLLGLME